MGRLMRLFAENLTAVSPVAARMLNWSGDTSPNADNVPLRIAGGLHALVLLKRSPALAAVYPPNTATDPALWQAVEQSLISENDFLDDWINSPPQTNEIRRSAVLIALGHLLAEKYKLPFMLSELGASGGLNLQWDAYALKTPDVTYAPKSPLLTLTPDWNGPSPAVAQIDITNRAGVDLMPIDPQSPEGLLRLMAYTWPDQEDRLDRLRSAAPKQSTRVDKEDAAAWLPNRLAAQKEGTLHLVYHTIAMQYFPKNIKDACIYALNEAGSHATSQSPLAWLSMEADDSDKEGAALTLHLWPENQQIALGRADFHGRWVDWTSQTL